MSMAATPDKKTVVRELMELGSRKVSLQTRTFLMQSVKLTLIPNSLKSFMMHLHSLALKS